MGLHVHVFLIVHLRESTCHTYADLPTYGKQLTGHVAWWNRKCTSADWQLLLPHPVIKTAPKHTLNKKEMHFRAHTCMTRVKLPAIGWVQQGKAWLIGRLRTHRTCESKEEHTSDRCQNSQWGVVIGGAQRLWRLRGNKMRAIGDGEKTGGRGKARKSNWRRGITVKFWFSGKFMGNTLG